MVWGKRRLGNTEYFPAMDLLEELQMANAARVLIMVSVETSNPRIEDYYVGVPNKALLALFDGFAEAEKADLPKQVSSVQVLSAVDAAELDLPFELPLVADRL
jgi:hypothetical protein